MALETLNRSNRRRIDDVGVEVYHWIGVSGMRASSGIGQVLCNTHLLAMRMCQHGCWVREALRDTSKPKNVPTSNQ